MRTFALVALALLAAVAACDRPESAAARQIDHGLIHVRDQQAILRTDTVGHDQWQSQATFVLVDAENTAATDAMVTLGGALLDAAGRELAQLRLESLRIPAGESRTFALIDAEQRTRPEAAGARVEIRGAVAPSYFASVTINPGRVFTERDHVLLGGTVTNTARSAVKALIFAGFHDADGRPITRPFTLVELGSGQSQAVSFTGPPGSTKAYLFLGDAVF